MERTTPTATPAGRQWRVRGLLASHGRARARPATAPALRQRWSAARGTPAGRSTARRAASGLGRLGRVGRRTTPAPTPLAGRVVGGRKEPPHLHLVRTASAATVVKKTKRLNKNKNSHDLLTGFTYGSR